MKYRPLGSTGIKVSEMGLGCGSLGGGVFYKNDQQSIKVLDTAFEAGINFFDTADSYGYGHCEELIGRTFKNRRRKIIITTKVGYLPSSLARYGKVLMPILGPVRPLLQSHKGTLKQHSEKRQDFSVQHIKSAVEKSLKRLQTDYIDCYLLHSPPTPLIEQGDIFSVMEELKKDGKIRHYGLSALTVKDAVLAANTSPVSLLQVPFNLLEREASEELLPVAASKNIGVVARVPFARGLLTDQMAVKTGFNTGDNHAAQAAQKKREELSFLIANGKRNFSQAAIQYLLSCPQVSTIIPGTRSVAHLKENMSALDSPPFTTEEQMQVANLKLENKLVNE